MIIDELKRVHLKVSVDATGSARSFSFIFGVASDGLCPFESILAGAQPGGDFALTVSSVQFHDFFGHLLSALRREVLPSPIPSTVHLQGTIVGIEQPSAREIVQAVAQATAQGGCGGDCGCGCGESVV
jgi:hypothetical protein